LHIQPSSNVESGEFGHFRCRAAGLFKRGLRKGIRAALWFELHPVVSEFVAAMSQSRNFKRNVSCIVSIKVVRTISSEMDTVRKRLGELEERIRKIDKLDKLEARVRSLEEKLQRKQ